MRERALERTLERYEQRPHLIFWETTKACSLACRHCRASAQLIGAPNELTTKESIDLIDQVASFGSPSPILVLTGGDCLERPDLFDLISHARERSVRVGVAPSVTDRLTASTMDKLLEHNVRSISISLDGSCAATHDDIRGIAGHFERTVRVLGELAERGFRLQVNTTVMASNVDELVAVEEILRRCGVKIWEIFFLVGVGRGTNVEEISPNVAEDVCHFLVDVSRFDVTVRTVEGPFFRRVQAERDLRGDDDPAVEFGLGPLYVSLRQQLVSARGPIPPRSPNPTLATGDGRGIVFVGHDGEVHSSGFLPISVGNVKVDSLVDIYRDSELFRSMRTGAFAGACGSCTYSRLCGGSRARAFSVDANVLGEDPLCANSDAAG